MQRVAGQFLLVLLSCNSVRKCNAVDSQCRDPLYEAHWFGAEGLATGGSTQPASLLAIPSVEVGLKLCPAYNGKASCCNIPFEGASAQYFSYFRNVILPSKLARVTAHHDSVADVRNTSAYAAATREEKAALGAALERFNLVLAPAVHGPCFEKLLTYCAGMNCFACKRDWAAYTSQANGQVIRVHVDPSVCMQLWVSCEAFGGAAKNLYNALMDSLLSKQAKKPFLDLSMFFDQQVLCDWLHDEVALHPFRRPSETELETSAAVASMGAAPIVTTSTIAPGALQSPIGAGVPVQSPFAPKTVQATVPVATTAPPAAPMTTMPPMQTPSALRRLGIDGTGAAWERELDVLQEGERSGFDITWYVPSSTPGKLAQPLLLFALTVASSAFG